MGGGIQRSGKQHDTGFDIRLDAKGNVYVSGGSIGTDTSVDYVAIKYSPVGL